MKKELKLEVGKSYLNRKGVVVKIVSRDPFIIEGFIFFSDEDECYQSNGRYQWEDDHPEDLIEEVVSEPIRAINKDETWLNTHYEVVAAMEQALSEGHKKLTAYYNDGGTIAKWNLAKGITSKFEDFYAGILWNGEFLESINEFVQEELSEL